MKNQGYLIIDIYGSFDPCVEGQRQSPVDLVPSELLYDPGLDPVYINQNQVRQGVRSGGQG